MCRPRRTPWSSTTVVPRFTLNLDAGQRQSCLIDDDAAGRLTEQAPGAADDSAIASSTRIFRERNYSMLHRRALACTRDFFMTPLNVSIG